MISRFFIDRPIFAAVIALFFVLAGLAAMRTLPIAQYPEIAPPVVTVTAVYPGASAEVIEKTVAAPLERSVAIEWTAVDRPSLGEGPGRGGHQCVVAGERDRTGIRSVQAVCGPRERSSVVGARPEADGGGDEHA